VKGTLASAANHKASTSAAVKFIIAPKKITPAVTLAKAILVYNGKVQKPAVTVKAGTTKLAASNYKVAYLNSSKKATAASKVKVVGRYYVKVTCKGNYAGTKTVAFKIIPKGTGLSKMVAASKGFTAIWVKQAAKTAGYQVQYASNAKFKSAGIATVRDAKKTSVKVSKLKSKTTYWVRVRTFKMVGKTAFYSSWSASKKVTAK